MVLEESRGSKSEGLCHSVRYQNQTHMREKIELSSMSQRPRVIRTKISGEFSFAATKKSNNKKMHKILRGGRKLASCCPGVEFATPCHPMATGLLH